MQAAMKLEEMVSKGYFGSDSLGIGYDDANSMFINGEETKGILPAGRRAEWSKPQSTSVHLRVLCASSDSEAGGEANRKETKGLRLAKHLPICQ